MNIIGLDFLTDESALITMDDVLDSFDKIKIQNGVFDDLFISKDTDNYGNAKIPTTWDSSTVLHAQFNGNLIAGNLNYLAETISKMRVKRREAGSSKWITLYEHPITKAEDFSFIFIDRYAKVGDYEYCIVPVIEEQEQFYISEKVTSFFDGIVLCDAEMSYKSIADEQISTISRNRPNNIVTTLESKYPYVVYNGQANYESGQASGVFVQIDWQNKRLLTDGIPKYSQEVMRFMMNGRPKILKTFDGRIWMVDITGSPSASVGNHPNQVSVSFEFVEIGNPDSSSDMYNNAFIDVNVERS